jgi:hypothetical protein
VSTQTISTQDNRWIFFGDWTQLPDPLLSSEPSQDYRISTTKGSTASISFLASAVTITGIRNTTVGHYNITLDGTTTTLNGQSDWLEPSTLFLQGGLDELSEHNLTITNADDASLAIAGLNLTLLSGGTPWVRLSHVIVLILIFHPEVYLMALRLVSRRAPLLRWPWLA